MSHESYYRAHTRDDGETETEIEVEIAVHSWGTPESGLFGPPEDYDPGSGPEIEILQAHRLNPDGSHGDEVELTAAELKRIRTAFLENPPEPDADDH